MVVLGKQSLQYFIIGYKLYVTALGCSLLAAFGESAFRKDIEDCLGIIEQTAAVLQ